VVHVKASLGEPTRNAAIEELHQFVSPPAAAEWYEGFSMIDSNSSNSSSIVADIFNRHRKAIILWPLGCVIAGVLFYIFCPRTYQSEARLFLRVGRESVGIDPAATTGQTMPLYTADRKDEVRSTQEIFRSRTVAAAVVDELGPEVILGRGADTGGSVAEFVTKPIGWVKGFVSSLDPISDRETAIITVERSLFVGGEQQATMIILRYTAKSPQLAQQVCREIVRVAQQEYMRVHRSAESTPFFTEQQNRLREQLDTSLEALRKAKNEMGLSNVDQRRETLETQYRAVELDRLSTNQQLATATASIADLKKQLVDVPERQVTAKKSMPNQGADLLRDRLYQLQVRSMELQSRYNESHPLVVAVNDQLTEAEKVVAEQSDQREETTDEINPIYRELSLAMKREQSVAAGLEARLIALDKQREAVLVELRELNGHDVLIDQLSRDADVARDRFLQYSRTMEEARIDLELQNENINNLSRAQEPTLAERPVNPSKKLTAAGTVCLAIGGVFAAVLFSESTSGPSDTINQSQVVNKRSRIRRRIKPKNGQALAVDIPPLPK
jgi:polysaccharide biosynthesis protein PslE